MQAQQTYAQPATMSDNKPLQVGEANPMPTSSSNESSRSRFIAAVNRLVSTRFDAVHAIRFLRDATDGNLYLTGGTLRRALLRQSCCIDIDLMCDNGDARAFFALDTLGVAYTLNSHRHRRYRWNTLEVDIFEPKTFLSGHENVESALREFDLKVNALAVHLGTNIILDPFNILAQNRAGDVGVNWACWDSKFGTPLAVLAIRLLRVVHESPGMFVSKSDARRLRAEVIPKLRECKWNEVHYRFPLGKSQFLAEFEALLAAAG